MHFESDAIERCLRERPRRLNPERTHAADEMRKTNWKLSFRSSMRNRETWPRAWMTNSVETPSRMTKSGVSSLRVVSHTLGTLVRREE